MHHKHATPSYQGFVEILDGLDEVRLPEDEVDRFGLFDVHGRELHVELLLFSPPTNAAR